jgi:hypothetical protein
MSRDQHLPETSNERESSFHLAEVLPKRSDLVRKSAGDRARAGSPIPEPCRYGGIEIDATRCVTSCSPNKRKYVQPSLMSAFGTEQTFQQWFAMSALGVKQTSKIHPVMSAFDPKRTMTAYETVHRVPAITLNATGI